MRLDSQYRCSQWSETSLPVVAVNTSATGGRLNTEQTVYVLYIALAGADLILVLLSIVLLFGVEPVIRTHTLFILPRACDSQQSLKQFFYLIKIANS